jgi:DNA-binding transcriptional LysR family regulator
MDFEQLRIFMVLAEEGTYLGAANRMATSRSRVRRKLDQLEREAGTPLIFRDQGILRPTPAGEVLVRRGRELLEDADQLISHVHEVGTAPTGRLKIAMPIGPPTAGWDPIRQSLQERFSDLQIELLFDRTPTGLLPGQAEIAISYDEEIPRGCNAIELGCYPMRLFVSAHYLARHGSPESIEELKEHRVAMWRSPNQPIGRIPRRDGRSLQIDPHFVTDDPAVLYRLSIEGAFISYLPELPELTDPSLKTLFDDQLIETVRPRAMIPDILADLPRIREFIESTQHTMARDVH